MEDDSRSSTKDMFGFDSDDKDEEEMGGDEADLGERIEQTLATTEAPEIQRQKAKEQEEREKASKTIVVEMPRQKVIDASKYESYLIPMPNYIDTEVKYYDPMTYQRECPVRQLREGSTEQRDLVSRVLTIRRKADGRSNARVLQWEDGSYSLQIGGAVFDLITSSSRARRKTTNFVLSESPNGEQVIGPVDQRAAVSAPSNRNIAFRTNTDYSRAVDTITNARSLLAAKR